MNKLTKTLFFFFLSIHFLNAQNTLKGVVKNPNGYPLSKVHIYTMVKEASSNTYLKDLKTDIITDSTGIFQLNYDKNQEPLLYVEAMGFERKKLKITTDTLTILLTPISNISSQNGKRTEEIPVRGVCGMCKKRIEETAYSIRGVQSAQWSAEKQALKITYDASKTDSETIQKRIALIGHDTPQYKADQSTYDQLPKCCRYRDGIKIH